MEAFRGFFSSKSSRMICQLTGEVGGWKRSVVLQQLLEMLVISCRLCKTKVDSRLLCDFPKIC